MIASQAVISGAYSLSRQAVQLGFLPRLTVHHTSPHAEAQIYMPAVNWALFVVVAAVVIGFGSSARLGSAYGIAVSGTFVITTVLFLAVARWRWRWRPIMIAAFGSLLLPVEGVFLATNLTEIDQGGWLPLAIGIGLYALMMTWDRGRAIVAPRANVEHNHVLHDGEVIITARSVNIPRVDPDHRITIDELGYTDDDITHVTAPFGFQEEPDIPAALRLASEKGLECDIDFGAHGPTYFLSSARIRVTDTPGLRRWRKRLFVAIWRNSANPVEYFRFPDRRAITMGWDIPL